MNHTMGWTPFVDRLVHNAYRLELKGETMRKNTGADPEKQTPADL